MDENTPEMAPGGALTPPPRQVIAIAASSRNSPQRPSARGVPVRESLRALVDAVLDQLDLAADRIADAAGLR